MSQIFTGARARVSIGGTVVGFAGGVNVTVEDTLTDVDILGQLEVGDLAETAHKCNFSLNYFKALETSSTTVVNAASPGAAAVDSAANMGTANPIDQSFKSNPGKGGVAAGNMALMRAQTYFDCEILDDITGDVIFMMKDCKYQGGTGQVDARGIWQGTWNFKSRLGYGV